MTWIKVQKLRILFFCHITNLSPTNWYGCHIEQSQNLVMLELHGCLVALNRSGQSGVLI